MSSQPSNQFSNQNSSENSNECWLYNFPEPVPYLQAWAWQQQIVKTFHQNLNSHLNSHLKLPDALIILEHPPVYTLGQGSSWEFVKFDPKTNLANLEWHRTERGGEVTYHAPGQIVAYPILNLRNYRQDLHWYLRQLEEVIILTLASHKLVGERISGLTGVWVEGQKIAQIGIKASKWITMHGLSINVDMDMAGFDRIVPCGISDRRVCQMRQFIPDIELDSVKQSLIQAFAQIFGHVFTQKSTQDLFDN